MIREVILVTGAPRSGTTPMGNVLASLPGAVSLYEPMNLSGDRRFTELFPMPGEPGFSEDDLAAFLADLRALRLRYRRQRFPPAAGPLKRLAIRTIGTRALASYRLARLTPFKDTLIWKDPLAVFCAAHGARAGYRTVLTFRPPLAHAASYKRLGWLPDLAAIYPRYEQAYGAVPAVAARMDRLKQDPVGAAALLWHLIHRSILALPADIGKTVFFHCPEAAGTDEVSAHDRLFAWLGRPMPAKVRAGLAARAAAPAGGAPKAGVTHDWNRSAAQANAYWQDVLSAAEAGLVTEMNASLWEDVRRRIAAEAGPGGAPGASRAQARPAAPTRAGG